MYHTSDIEDAESPMPPAGKAAARMHHDSQDLNNPGDDDANASYEQFKKSLPWMQDEDDASQLSSGSLSDSSKNQHQRYRMVSRAITPFLALEETPAEPLGLPTIQTARAPSPGLFITSREASPELAASARIVAPDNSNSDSDLPTAGKLSEALFQEKIAQKRAERKAREDQSKSKKEARRRKLEALSSRRRKERDDVEESESPDEDEKAADSRLTQETTRPNARKASKKALEEMSKEIRENQRFNRSLQLTHQAKTKRKITKNDLFKAFNFRQRKNDPVQPQTPREQESSVPTSSDVDMANDHDTPPTSPAVHDDSPPKDFMMRGALPSAATPPIMDLSNDEDDLPDLQVLLAQPTPSLDKVKGQARTRDACPKDDPRPAQIPPKRQKPLPSPDSDDDLEIVTNKPNRFPVFDRLPAKKNLESDSLLNLRVLAHLTSPGRSRNKSSSGLTLNAMEMQSSLIRRGRQQAKAALLEKIEQEKVAGTYISPEELQKQQEDRENDLEKLRKDVEELGKKERKTAKDNGEVDESQLLPSDDEDEAYVGSDSDAGDMGDDEEEDIELSGSEDEESGNDEVENDGRALFDEEADENEVTETLPAENNSLDNSDTDSPIPTRANVIHRSRRVIHDDDEESEGGRPLTPMPTQTQSTANDNVAAAFGLEQAGSSPTLGLTQMFAGTMASMSQTQQNTAHDRKSQTKSLGYFRQLAMSTAPDFDATMVDDSQDVVIKNSQTAFVAHDPSQPQPQQCSIKFGISQFPGPGDADYSQSQLSDLPDPTQDAGFQMRTPATIRNVPASTTETVFLHEQQAPIPMKRFRIHRKSETSPSRSDSDEADVVLRADLGTKDALVPAVDAFNVLKKASKKKAVKDTFNKKKSEAKTMFEEQAQESEDEYAGLGGASEDESGGEMDEETAKMLDHGMVDLKEGELAAFHAEDERVRDEKNVQKLHKDIINGGLRRKRAANDDLLGAADDEWDEEAERRRKKQLDFRRAYDSMMKDGKLQKLNTDKTKAFLRAVQDIDEDPDVDFYDNAQEPNSIPDSQELSKSVNTQVEAESSHTTNPLKRKAELGSDENRAPPNLRRTAPTGNRPPPRPFTDQFDLRASLSNLLDEPDRIPDSQHDPASDSEGAEALPSITGSHDSGIIGTTSKAVIDRLALSRSASNATVTSESGSTHLAFHAPNKSGTGAGFRVPSLIRRATSGLSNVTTSTSSSGSSTPVVEATGVRMGGSNKSNIHYQAREAERKRVLDASEERRKGELKRKVRANKGQGGLRGVLGGAHGWS